MGTSVIPMAYQYFLIHFRALIFAISVLVPNLL